MHHNVSQRVYFYTLLAGDNFFLLVTACLDQLNADVAITFKNTKKHCAHWGSKAESELAN